MDRRENQLRFDWTINLGSILTILVLLGAIARYGNSILEENRNTNAKISIMWTYFVTEHPELRNLTADELELLSKGKANGQGR